MIIEWFGHSCFKLSSSEGSAVFDPYAPHSVPGLELPPLRADAVICSHGHSDHSYSEGVELSGNTPKFTLRRIPCFHDEAHGAKRGENLMSIVEAEGLRVLHAGDLGHSLSADTITAIGEIDLLLIPVGGHFTVDATTAFDIARAIKPRLCVPMHYRGDGFGYDVISTVEPFASLCGKVERLDVSAFDPRDYERGTTLILRCPGGGEDK